MSDVTLILQSIERGDTRATEQLLPVVYEELRRLAACQMTQERADHTLQPTALVHEAYLRLVDASQIRTWDSRWHFFSAAAEAMRRILIDHARRRASAKSGGDWRRVEAGDFVDQIPGDPDLLIDLDTNLSRLAAEDPEAAELVKLRLFAGLTVSEAGQLVGMSRRTAYRTWDYARLWFAMKAGESEE